MDLFKGKSFSPLYSTMRKSCFPEDKNHLMFYYVAKPSINQIEQITKLLMANYIDDDGNFLQYSNKNVRRRKMFLEKDSKPLKRLVCPSLIFKIEDIFKALIDAGNGFVALGIIDTIFQKRVQEMEANKSEVSVSSIFSQSKLKQYFETASDFNSLVYERDLRYLDKSNIKEMPIEEYETKRIFIYPKYFSKSFQNIKARQAKSFEIYDLLFFFKESYFYCLDRKGFYEYINHVHMQSIKSK